MSKSYWQRMACDGPHSREAILSWLSPVCDGMTPLRADILCDTVTDREKRLRVLVVDQKGVERWANRTFGKRYSISLKPKKNNP